MRKFDVLQNALTRNGWSVARDKFPIEHPWALEWWDLKSLWRPVGRAIVIALVLDPQCEKQTPTEADVWVLKIAPVTPDGPHWIDVRVSPRWPERVEEIVGKVEELRSS